MQSNPDGTYKWIGNVVDHFSKYHVIFPMAHKTAEETAQNLVVRVFFYFGLPIQSYNGTEFVNIVLRAVVVLWPGKCSFINGSPGHSQSQGAWSKKAMIPFKK